MEVFLKLRVVALRSYYVCFSREKLMETLERLANPMEAATLRSCCGMKKGIRYRSNILNYLSMI